MRFDAFDDHTAARICGRTARALGWTDRRAVDCALIALRQVRPCAVAQIAPLFEQQNGAQHPRCLVFDEQHDVLEHPLELRALGDAFEHRALTCAE